MIRLSPPLFNRQIQSAGQSVLWRRASLCPCAGRDHYSGGASQDCPVCTGRGWSWAKGVPSKASIVGARRERKQSDFGQWEAGDVAVSVGSDTPLWNAGEKDRITFLDSSLLFQAALVNDGNARLDFEVVRFERCFWLREGDEAFREATLPKRDPLTGRLAWASGAVAPDAGARFTVTGLKRPDFFLLEHLPVARGHFSGSPLPRLFKCRAFDLLGR